MKCISCTLLHSDSNMLACTCLERGTTLSRHCMHCMYINTGDNLYTELSWGTDSCRATALHSQWSTANTCPCWWFVHVYVCQQLESCNGYRQKYYALSPSVPMCLLRVERSAIAQVDIYSPLYITPLQTHTQNTILRHYPVLVTE